MKELVELLTQTRQDKQITLKEIADETKIQMRYLQSLESGDFSVFPGEVYLKGAIMRYAETVGLDAKEMMVLYHRLKGEDESDVEEKVAVIAKTSSRRTGIEIQGPSLATGLFILAFLIIAGWIWFASQKEEPGNDFENGNEAYGHSGVSIQVPQPPLTETEQLPAEGELILVKSSGGDTVFNVRGVERLEIKMTFHANCWVRLMVDGEKVLERTFRRGEEYTVNAENSIHLRLGHPPGVSLIFEEKEIEEVRQQLRSHNYIFDLD